MDLFKSLKSSRLAWGNLMTSQTYLKREGGVRAGGYQLCSIPAEGGTSRDQSANHSRRDSDGQAWPATSGPSREGLATVSQGNRSQRVKRAGPGVLGDSGETVIS